MNKTICRSFRQTTRMKCPATSCRAAQRGTSASELMGLVLSRFLIRHELGRNQYAGWYFLDDYADWLGQQEEHIADLLALSPRTSSDGQMRLLAIVTEAKYVDHTNGSQAEGITKAARDTLGGWPYWSGNRQHAWTGKCGWPEFLTCWWMG